MSMSQHSYKQLGLASKDLTVTNDLLGMQAYFWSLVLYMDVAFNNTLNAELDLN